MRKPKPLWPVDSVISALLLAQTLHNQPPPPPVVRRRIQFGVEARGLFPGFTLYADKHYVHWEGTNAEDILCGRQVSPPSDNRFRKQKRL